MNPERAKFYTELMKTLTAFILGTGAGIYAIITNGKAEEYVYFLYFISILCALSIGIFVVLFVYLDQNTWLMETQDIIGLTLAAVTTVSFGTVFVIIFLRAVKGKKPNGGRPEILQSAPRRFKEPVL